MIRRKTATVALATAGLIALPSAAAWADNINQSIEDNAASVTVTAGQSSSKASIKVVSVKNNDGDPDCNIDANETFVLSFTAPAGVSVPDLAVPACDTFYPLTINTTASAQSGTITATIKTNTTGTGTFNNNVSIPVTISAPVVVTPPPPPPAPDADGDGVPDASDNCLDVANANQADADNDGKGNACDTNSYAPAVGNQAGAANGNEGTVGNPATSGSFTDQDGNDSLTITKVSGAGDVVDNGNGSFSWSHTTTDDASGSVTVKASDGEHADATQTFSWTAANVAPVITSVTQTRVSKCAVTLGATYTDAGSADTHVTSVVWADNDSTDLARTFTTAGTYSAEVTVTDDDGGSANETVSGVRAYNTASAIMQPINSTGTRSGFKIGSTIPVKITVTGCDGASVSTLTPSVQLQQNDTTADVAVNEASVTEVATNGKLMRWDGTQYIYNLSTKLSQFTGAALTQGTWTVSVNDPSFLAPVKAAFDLRK